VVAGKDVTTTAAVAAQMHTRIALLLLRRPSVIVLAAELPAVCVELLRICSAISSVHAL
jgi:hypothetical protein